jgi:hypothetical protein
MAEQQELRHALRRLSRALLIPAAILGLDTTAVLAQTRIGSLDALRDRLAPGDFVSLVQIDGETIAGRLLRVGATELDLRTAAPRPSGQTRGPLDRTIALDAIQSLERPRDPSRNGALLGAAIGAGVGGGMFASALAVDRNEVDEWAPIYLGYTAAFTGLGALLGWALDSMHSKPHVTYRASPSRASVQLMPLPSRARGIALGVSF